MLYHPFKIKFYKICRLLLVPGLLMLALPAAAKDFGKPAPSIWSNPLGISLMVIAALLLLVIYLLSNALMAAARSYYEKSRELEKNSGKSPGAVPGLAVFILLSLLPAWGMAQTAADPAAATAVPAAAATIGGISTTAFYVVVSAILIEILVILAMAWFLKTFVEKEKLAEALVKKEEVPAKPPFIKTIWEKMNSFRPKEQEADMDLGHEYDGIRELDNRLPPWWLYGFYLTILFAAIYLWRFHVSHTGPSSREEFDLAMKVGEEEKMAYLAQAADNVDETTVKYLSGKADLEAGKAIYNEPGKCATCHGPDGSGLVNGFPGAGPNLTDPNWIHGGSMADIFKSIKYGWPEKGMKSWQEEMRPVEIAQVASYIRSLKGTAAKGKAPDGPVYEEAAPAPAAPDSVSVKKDSLGAGPSK